MTVALAPATPGPVVQLPTITDSPLTRRLRTRQALTRVMVAQRLVSEAMHPARSSHVDPQVRSELEEAYSEAATALRRAQTLLEGGR